MTATLFIIITIMAFIISASVALFFAGLSVRMFRDVMREESSWVIGTTAAAAATGALALAVGIYASKFAVVISVN